jgi:biotin transport system substrate-specific component
MNYYSDLPHQARRVSSTLSEWRLNASWQEKTVYAFLFALLTAMAAQVRFLLPFTPVPFTGQVLVVLLGAVVLGRFGGVAQIMYLGMGATLGWFTGMIGMAAFIGVTGGYLVGFVAASFLIGELVERRKQWSMTFILLTLSAASLLILFLGSLWLVGVLHISLEQALLLGAAPFLVVEAIKVALAAAGARLFLPMRGG